MQQPVHQLLATLIAHERRPPCGAERRARQHGIAHSSRNCRYQLQQLKGRRLARRQKGLEEQLGGARRGAQPHVAHEQLVQCWAGRLEQQPPPC